MNSPDATSITNEALLNLLSAILDARTESEVADVIRDYEEHLTTEFLLRVSAFCVHMEKVVDTFGLPNRFGPIVFSFFGNIYMMLKHS